jgi:hypothetical protein
MFYKDGTKIVPSNIGDMLNARALAYWIMDDGGKGQNGETILHTLCDAEASGASSRCPHRGAEREHSNCKKFNFFKVL